MVQYKTIDIQTPANGRLAQSTVFVLGEQDQVLFTDKADLTSAVERRKVGKRIAVRLDVDPQKAQDDLERSWNDLALQYQAVRAQAAAPSPEGPPPGEAATSTDPLAGTAPEIVAEAQTLLQDPELVRQVADDIDDLGVA